MCAWGLRERPTSHRVSGWSQLTFGQRVFRAKFLFGLPLDKDVLEGFCRMEDIQGLNWDSFRSTKSLPVAPPTIKRALLTFHVVSQAPALGFPNL